MKRVFYAVLCLGLVSSSIFAPSLRAQEGGDMSEDSGGRHWQGRRHGEDHDGWMDLTSDQKAKLKAAFEAKRKALEPLRDQFRDARRELRDALSNKASDKDIAAALQKLKDARKAMRQENEKFMAERDSILTPTQQAKFFMMMEHKRRGHEMGYGKHGQGQCGGRGGDDGGWNHHHHQDDRDGE